jgi:uncharacterized protein (DUF362 family)
MTLREAPRNRVFFGSVSVYAEFEAELARTHARFEGNPRGELTALLLFALEREQIVSVAYRESVIRQHLSALSIPADARTVFEDALVWVWKDEEMHALFLRGLLLRQGSFPVRVRSLLAQASGALGGWAGSVLHHVRWKDAPAARAAARALTELGSLSGKVPRAVKEHLDYRGFRGYCEFNLDAERTAARSFEHMAGIAPPGLVPSLRRMQKDEEEHARVFEAFVAALDAADRLSVEPGALAERVRDVGEYYVARDRRLARNPLGSGGPVLVATGGRREKLSVFRSLLERSGLGARLDERRRALGRDLEVAVKPSFMLGYDRRDLSAITDPELIRALAAFLRERGAESVVVCEGTNHYDAFFARRSVLEVARYFGIEGDFEVRDLSLEQEPHAYPRGMAHETIGRTWRDADFRIAFGKMRGHPTDHFWLTLAVAEGLGPRHDAYMFLERQAHRHTASMTLVNEFPFDFALLDAYDSAPDGLMGMYGAARPRRPHRLYAAADALSLDIVAARHMGVADPLASRVLAAAVHWFGDPSSRIEVVGEDTPIRGWRHPRSDFLSAVLSAMADPVYMLASGRGALFMSAMDEEAFPPLRRTGPFVRAARYLVRTFFNMRR